MSAFELVMPIILCVPLYRKAWLGFHLNRVLPTNTEFFIHWFYNEGEAQVSICHPTLGVAEVYFPYRKSILTDSRHTHKIGVDVFLWIFRPVHDKTAGTSTRVLVKIRKEKMLFCNPLTRIRPISSYPYFSAMLPKTYAVSSFLSTWTV